MRKFFQDIWNSVVTAFREVNAAAKEEKAKAAAEKAAAEAAEQERLQREAALQKELAEKRRKQLIYQEQQKEKREWLALFLTFWVRNGSHGEMFKGSTISVEQLVACKDNNVFCIAMNNKVEGISSVVCAMQTYINRANFKEWLRNELNAKNIELNVLQMKCDKMIKRRKTAAKAYYDKRQRLCNELQQAYFNCDEIMIRQLENKLYDLDSSVEWINDRVIPDIVLEQEIEQLSIDIKKKQVEKSIIIKAGNKNINIDDIIPLYKQGQWKILLKM